MILAIINIESIIANLDKIVLLIAAIAGVVIAAVQAWKRIKAEIESVSKNELAVLASPIILKNETSPLEQALEVGMAMPKAEAITNEGKNLIAATKIMAENAPLAKKAGLKTVKDVSEWISTLYPIVKPAIKAIAGKKK